MSERRATLVHNEKAGDKRHDRAALAATARATRAVRAARIVIASFMRTS